MPGRGLDRCQAPAAGRMDASKHGVWIGAKHPLRRSRTRPQSAAADGTRTHTRSALVCYPAYWFASSCELPRSLIGSAAVQTAIEYEYRFTEYRFAEYEYDEIRCEGTCGGLGPWI